MTNTKSDKPDIKPIRPLQPFTKDFIYKQMVEAIDYDLDEDNDEHEDDYEETIDSEESPDYDELDEELLDEGCCQPLQP